MNNRKANRRMRMQIESADLCRRIVQLETLLIEHLIFRYRSADQSHKLGDAARAEDRVTSRGPGLRDDA